MIEHQQQPTFNTCMSACIAMVASRPVDEVVDLWHEKFQSKGEWLDDALDHYGIPYFYGHLKQGTLRNGFIYFLSVASLNIVGGLHQVIAILVDGEKPVFLDPVMGRPGSKYYVFGEPKTDSEVSINRSGSSFSQGAKSMINNEALSQPVAYTDREELESMQGPDADTYANLWAIPHGCGQDIALYSQEYVTALRAESAKWFKAFEKAVSVGARYEERIAELSVGNVGNALLERENHHVEVVANLTRRLAELERRLQQPALADVMAERQRQINAEGWTPEHDDEHENTEMAFAAACYALYAGNPHPGQGYTPPEWPWDAEFWRPSTERRDLVKAGALILAEIERLDRAAAKVEGE